MNLEDGHWISSSNQTSSLGLFLPHTALTPPVKHFQSLKVRTTTIRKPKQSPMTATAIRLLLITLPLESKHNKHTCACEHCYTHRRNQHQSHTLATVQRNFGPPSVALHNMQNRQLPQVTLYTRLRGRTVYSARSYTAISRPGLFGSASDLGSTCCHSALSRGDFANIGCEWKRWCSTVSKVPLCQGILRLKPIIFAKTCHWFLQNATYIQAQARLRFSKLCCSHGKAFSESPSLLWFQIRWLCLCRPQLWV